MLNPSAISIERTNLGGGVDDADGETPVRVKMDATSQSLRVNLWVWNTSTLAWVKQPYFDFSGLQTSIDNLTTSIGTLTTAIDALTTAIEAM